MIALIRSWPPAGAAKSVRCVSTRPDSRRRRCSGGDLQVPPPSSATLFVELVMVSTSPVDQLAGPPG